jgi:hypothetical protein
VVIQSRRSYSVVLCATMLYSVVFCDIRKYYVVLCGTMWYDVVFGCIAC